MLARWNGGSEVRILNKWPLSSYREPCDGFAAASSHWAHSSAHRPAIQNSLRPSTAPNEPSSNPLETYQNQQLCLDLRHWFHRQITSHRRLQKTAFPKAASPSSRTLPSARE